MRVYDLYRIICNNPDEINNLDENQLVCMLKYTVNDKKTIHDRILNRIINLDQVSDKTIYDIYFYTGTDAFSRLSILSTLLYKISDIDILNKFLYRACADNNIEYVEKFISLGANDFNSAFTGACFSCNFELIKFIHLVGGENIKGDVNCTEILKNNKIEIINYLLENRLIDVYGESFAKCLLIDGDLNLTKYIFSNYDYYIIVEHMLKNIVNNIYYPKHMDTIKEKLTFIIYNGFYDTNRIKDLDKGRLYCNKEYICLLTFLEHETSYKLT
jgi:hypothetical protein